MKSVLNSPYFFWAVLAMPAIPMTFMLASGEPDAVNSLLHPTGEFAARFMIIAMMLTPLRMLMPKVKAWTWLIQRRRYLGVAAFFYALAHTVLYLVDTDTLSAIIGDLPNIYIWTGWLAFLMFVPLAVTSTDGWVRRLGRRWKTLQRAVYVAAVFTLLHWASLHDWGGVGPALVHFVPLGLLETCRIWRIVAGNRQHAQADGA